MTREEKRLKLHADLVALLGSKNVYFQPPESLKMSYPAIVYETDGIRNMPANNGVYIQQHEYQVTVIDEDPDSEIVEKVSMLPTARYERHFDSNNLNHDVFNLII